MKRNMFELARDVTRTLLRRRTRVAFHDLATPVSTRFERGTPIDRHYTATVLVRHRAAIVTLGVVAHA